MKSAFNFLFMFVMLISACTKHPSVKVMVMEERYMALNDSAVRLLQMGNMHEDSLALVQALSFTDSILSFDTITAHRCKTCPHDSSMNPL